MGYFPPGRGGVFALDPVSRAGILTDAALDAQSRVNSALSGVTGSATAFDLRSGTSYQLALADQARVQTSTDSNPFSLIIPRDDVVPFPTGWWCEFLQHGSGQLSVGGGSTVSNITVPFSNRGSSNTTTLNFTVRMPSGGVVQLHDSMLVEIEVAGNRVFGTIPSGFVQVGTIIGPSGANSVLFKHPDVTQAMVDAAAAGGAGADLTFSLTGGSTAIQYAAVLTGYRGTDRVDMVEGVAPAGASTTNTQTTPTYTTTTAGCVEVSMIGRSTGATADTAVSTPPAGITLDDGTFTTGTAANSAVAIGHGTLAGVALGTVIGGRAWTGGFGNARTVALKPYTAPGVSFDGDARKCRIQGSPGTLVKLPYANTWLITGDLVP